MDAGSAAILAASALACRMQALPPLSVTFPVASFFTTLRTF
jgi:hypothetical protein